MSQVQNGKEHPIACYSKTLTGPERNYATNEREALACLLAMEHWEKFLRGRHFTLRTDHKPLLQLLHSPTSKRQSAKFERWRERLGHFDFSTEYLPRPLNQVADDLSRLHQKAQDLCFKGIRKEDLTEATAQDKDLVKVMASMGIKVCQEIFLLIYRSSIPIESTSPSRRDS